MITKSPSGALSPYYYKGGYFHGIHYGSYHDNSGALLDMIDKEEEFILKSPERRRVLIDLYESDLTQEVMDRLIKHLERLSPKLVKLAIATDKKGLRYIRRSMKKAGLLLSICCYFGTDMEEGKTWLVSDGD